MPSIRPRQGSRLLSLTLLYLAATTPAGAEWRRVDSPNFVVVGDVGARDLRDIAVKFEGFRETLSRVLTERATATAVPTVVIVFPSDRAFTPFKPTFEGKPIELAGLFVGRRDINYIALVADGREDRLKVVFHEYAHLVISNVTHTLPVWLNEGLAEYYSTYEVSRGGREAMIGRPVENHLLRLGEARLLALDELLQVTHDSPLYNEGDRRSIFYAQSWALTHLILMGEPDRSAQLSAFMAKIAAGAPPMQAWLQAFGASMDRELQDYIRRRAFRVLRFTFPDKLATFDAPAVPLPAADAQAFLADFLVQQQRYDEASERLAAASKLEESNTRVQAIQALLDIARQEHADAERRLLGLGDVSDWLIAYSAGTAIADLIEDRIASPDAAHLAAAHRLFGIARRDRPDLANALARLASMDVQVVGGPSAETVSAIERARSLAPGRHDYTMVHARILAQRLEFAAARNLLGPLMSSAIPTEIREPARRIMGYIVQMEAASTAATAGSGSNSRAAGKPAAAPASIPGGFQPIYRKLEAGEQRLEGELERIECFRGGAAIFHLRTADGPARAAVRQMSKVDFITYRDDIRGDIKCGVLPKPLPVYVAWRPGEGQAGTKIAVAIEFLK
jgi:Protein of unknown function (DUF1570)